MIRTIGSKPLNMPTASASESRVSPLTALAVGLALTLLATGCTVTPAKPAPAAANKGVGDFKEVAVSGQPLRIDFEYSINPDCSVYPGTIEIRIVTPPQHGTVTINDGLAFTRFSEKNQRYACNTKPSPGKLVYYQSAPDYHGPDLIVERIIYPSGNANTFTFRVTVE